MTERKFENSTKSNVLRNVHRLYTHRRQVNDHNLNAFLERGAELPHAILFTDKPSTTPMYKALSLAMKNRMVCGEAKK